MNATELRAKINRDHQRLRELEAQIAQGPLVARRQFDHLIIKAKAELTQLEIQLAAIGNDDACRMCGDTIPSHFLVCRVCFSEVPLKLKAQWWGASGHAHARRANGYAPAEIARFEAAEAEARRAIFAHLQQHSSAVA